MTTKTQTVFFSQPVQQWQSDAGTAVADAPVDNAAAGEQGGDGEGEGGTPKTDTAPPTDQPKGGDPVSTPEGDATDAPPQDWYADIVGEDESLKKVAMRYDSPAAAVKALADTQKALRDSGRIKIPGENASEEERAQFREQLGIPEKPTDYEIKVKPPEGVELGEADKAFIDKTLQKLHGRGDFLATPDAANAVHEIAYDMIAEREAQLDASAAWQREQGEKELKTEWGDQYDINMKFAEAAVASHFGKDWDEVSGWQLADGTMLGDKPEFRRAMMNAGRATTEDMNFLRTLTGKSEMNGASLDERISEIQGWYSTDPSKYAKHQQELQTLMARRDRTSGEA